MDAIIDTLLPGCLPYNLAECAAGSVERTNSLYDSFSYASDKHSTIAQCCLQSASPSSLIDWPIAYALYTDTNTIIEALRKYTPKTIPAEIIQRVHMSYRSYLKKGSIVLLGEKLLLFKDIHMVNKLLSLIIVPDTLRRTLFDHYHSGPSGGHMGEYKTLYRLRMRFFWPNLRE